MFLSVYETMKDWLISRRKTWSKSGRQGSNRVFIFTINLWPQFEMSLLNVVKGRHIHWRSTLSNDGIEPIFSFLLSDFSVQSIIVLTSHFRIDNCDDYKGTHLSQINQITRALKLAMKNIYLLAYCLVSSAYILLGADLLKTIQTSSD